MQNINVIMEQAGFTPADFDSINAENLHLYYIQENNAVVLRCKFSDIVVDAWIDPETPLGLKDLRFIVIKFVGYISNNKPIMHKHDLNTKAFNSHVKTIVKQFNANQHLYFTATDYHLLQDIKTMGEKL